MGESFLYYKTWGITLKIVIQKEPFDPYQIVSQHQKTLAHQHGATMTFVGTMRDYNEEENVDSLFLEHYPGMTEKQIQQICDDARENWQILDLIIVHRTGLIQPGEPIVTIGVWSAHRSDAFNACRYIINALKTRAPFWKCEQLGGKKKWLTKNTTDTID